MAEVLNKSEREVTLDHCSSYWTDWLSENPSNMEDFNIQLVDSWIIHFHEYCAIHERSSNTELTDETAALVKREF